jgi:hypothetical protein
MQFIILHLTPSIEAVKYKPTLDFLAICRGLKRLEIHGLTPPKVPKTMQLCFGGLQAEEINFIDTAEHLVAGLKGLVVGISAIVAHRKAYSKQGLRGLRGSQVDGKAYKA